MFAANKTRHRLSGVGGGFTLFEAGTSSFVVPAGVTSISAVAIGGGGGGRDGDTASIPRDGGGGAAGYYGDGGGSNNAQNGSGGSGGMGGNFTTNDQSGNQVNGGGTFPFGFSGFSGPKGANNARGFMGSSSAGTTESGDNFTPLFGSGGGGGVGVGYGGGRGGVGAIRILWNTENAMSSFIAPATPTIISSQFFQVNSGSPPTPTIPAGVRVGDIVLVYTSYLRTDNVNPSTSGIPTNFVQLRQGNLNAYGTYRAKYALSKRIVLDAAIAGTTIVIPSEPSGTLVVGVFVLRGATGVNAFLNSSNIVERGIQETDISISSSQSFNATNQTNKGVPISLAFFVSYDGYPTGTVNWSGSTQITTGISTLGFFYKIYPFSAASTDDNITVTGAFGPRSGVLLSLTGY